MAVRWDDSFYVRAYEMAASGVSEEGVRQALGVVSRAGWQRWKDRKPALAEALRKGKERCRPGGKVATFGEYVYGRLPTHLKELWDKINRCDGVDSGAERAERLLADAGREARQHLFLYALVNSNFSRTDACRAVNISFQTLKAWIEGDPDFAALVDGIHQCKKDFFENALFRRVDEGDPACTIFANRTFNRDLYGEKQEHVHSGMIGHAHFDLDRVLEFLDAGNKRALLDAMRRAEELDGPAPAQLEVRAVAKVEAGG